MATHLFPSPHFSKLLRLALVLLVSLYVLLIGGTFDATVRFRVQLLNALLGGGLAVGWLLVRWRTGARLRFMGIEGPLCLCVAAQWLAVLFSVQPRLSLEWVACLTAWALAWVMLGDWLNSGWPRQFFVNALMVVAVIITGEAWVEVLNWFRSWAQVGLWPPVAFRLEGLLGHANLTAAALNLLWPVVLVRGWRAPRRLERVGWGSLLAGMFIAEFFTSSRAGWLAGAAQVAGFVGLLGLSAPDRAARLWRRWQALAMWVRLGLGGLAVVGALAGGWLLLRQAQHLTHGSLFTSRQSLWWPAWQMFWEHPLIGVGPDLYPWLWPHYVSVPPNEVVLHAHGFWTQWLGGSGLIGMGTAALLALAVARRLWRLWQQGADRFWLAALVSSLVGMGTHQLFDYFFGAPVFIFLVLVLAALALTLETELQPQPPLAGYRPLWLGLPLALVLGVMAYALPGAAWNDAALALADQQRWGEAAQLFARAAAVDPAFPLYRQAAAQAYTRAGDTAAAQAFWQQAVQAEPYWAIPQASLAGVTRDAAAMQQAEALAPQSYWLAVNTGELYEAAQVAALAGEAYQRALERGANPQALFWQQSPLRRQILAAWLADHPVTPTFLTQGEAALAAGAAAPARDFFEQARQANPFSNLPYVGLARAYWALGAEAQAQTYFETARRLPIYYLDQRLAGLIFEGDWAEAHGDRPGALNAYGQVFSIYAEYPSAGPGNYGYPWREWVTFHRAALPTDLIPQFQRADITPALDERLARLGTWYQAAGNLPTACYIWERVYREAPVSQSGHLWAAGCD